jgi:hypothetical protein
MVSCLDQLVGFYVESLSHFVVNSEEGVMRLLAMGTQVGTMSQSGRNVGA